MKTIDDGDLRELNLGAGDTFRVPVGARLTREAIDYAEDEGIEFEFESYAHRAKALGRPGPEKLDRISKGIAEGLLTELGRRAVRERAAAAAVPAGERTFVITAHGTDRPGVIAAVSGVLAREGVNIIDISQKVTAGMFALILLVDATASGARLGRLRYRLRARLSEIGVEFKIQKAAY